MRALKVTESDDVYGGRSKLAVAARLELTRTALGLDKGDFADKIGVKASAYSNLLAGINYPSVAVMFQICDALNVDPNWLLVGDSSGLRHSFADLLDRLHKERQRIRN